MRKPSVLTTLTIVIVLISATIYALAERERKEPQITTQKIFSFSGKTKIVTVKNGDSLGKFARELDGISWQDLRELNKKAHPSLIDNPSHIKPGWKLKIPVVE